MKYFFDILIIIIFLPFLIIVFVFLYLSVLFVLGGPVFFVQKRSGKNGKEFKIIKFRTMLINDKKEENRLTKFGNFLRNHSLDEIPEIINVIKGDMSLVGPRPLLMEYNDLYDDYQRQRLLVKPGITGLAQIYGRNNISWEEKFALDINYVNSTNLYMDIKIIFISLLRVVSDRNVYTKDNKFIEKFQGSKIKKK